MQACRHCSINRLVRASASLMRILRSARSDWISVAFKFGLFLGHEGVVSTGEILGLHADGLGFGLSLQRLLDGLGPLLVQALLGNGVGKCRAVGQGSVSYTHLRAH